MFPVKEREREKKIPFYRDSNGKLCFTDAAASNQLVDALTEPLSQEWFQYKRSKVGGAPCCGHIV